MPESIKVPTWLEKKAAMATVAQALGATAFNPYSHLCEMEFRALLDPSRLAVNRDTPSVGGAHANRAQVRTFLSHCYRVLPRPLYFNNPPASFEPYSDHIGFATPSWDFLEIDDAYVLMMESGPVVFDCEGQLVTDFGSASKDLVYFYDFDLRAKLAEARAVGGPALVICDDINQCVAFNYCHWMCDWATRLAFPGNLAWLREHTIIVAPLLQRAQHDAFAAFGIPGNKIAALEPWGCFKVEKLFVPNDIGMIQHPAYKGATTALNFLRGSIGCLPGSSGSARPDKIYVSRADAAGRYVLNEDAFRACLERRGYTTVTLTGKTLAEQVVIYREARSVIAIHGAGVTNALYCRPGAKLLEIFPDSYGTPAFRILAQSVGVDFATYIGASEKRERPDLDCIRIDIADFEARCGDWI